MAIADAQLFRDAFNASPIGIAVENLEGQPIFVNPALCRFLGFTEEELRGKHCVDFSPKEDAEKDWALFQQLRAGSIDHYQLEKRYFRRDGSLVWGCLSISLLNSRPSPLVIAMVEDITDKKNAEESLRESEERLRLAAQAGRMFAYSWDAATDLIERSGESSEILGVEKEQVPTGASVSAMIHPKDREKVEAAIVKLTVENPILRITYRITRPDGAVAWLERNSRAYFDAEGKVKRIVGMIVDVTEHKRNEEALSRHAAVIESSDDAIASGTLDGIIVSWNTGAQKIYGYTEAEAVGKPITMLVPPELADEEHKILEILRAGGRIEQLETVRVTKTGKRINVSLSVSPIKDSSGALVGVAGIARDISERKRHEEKLQEYEKAVEGAEDMIGVIDREYRLLLANRQYLKMRNLTREQVVGHFVPEILGAEIFETVIKPKLDECFQGKVVRYEMKFSYPTVGERDLSLSYFPIEGVNGVDRAACILRDITERKQAEERLRESEERLRLAQRAAGIGSFEWNIRTDAESWTPELEAMYGLPPGGFGGTHSGWTSLIHADDLAEVQRLVDEAKTGRPMTGEWRVVWPDGSVHWIAGRWQVLMDQYGKPWRVLGVNIDVTDRKRAEQALLEMNRALEAHSSLLRSREELLKTFVKNVPVAVAMLDHELRYLQVSDRWCNDNAVEAQELLGRLREELPEMPERWKEANRRALQGETLRADEERWESGGSTRWARWEARPWRNSDGTVGGILVFAEDITHRKQMEETLSGMTRKLIEAQEQERARIGRELHDDINQRLAMVAIELEQLHRNPLEIGGRLQQLREETIAISNDVQALSHELHSSKLEYLGVVAGMKSWCKEFSERQKVEVDFRSDARSVLSLDVGRTLFRVLQEALHNSFKHSGVKRIEVLLREESGEIHLIVSDSGSGFDVEAALQGKGLGLTSMRERVRLVNGTIAIDSKPMGGTTIQVRVPLESQQASQRAAG